MDFFVINWFQPKKSTQDKMVYIETDGHCFDSYEGAEDYARAEKARLNKSYIYQIMGLAKVTSYMITLTPTKKQKSIRKRNIQ